MISNRTIVEFGSGSTAMCAGINEDNEALFLMRSATPGAICRDIDDTTAKLTQTDPEVVILFTNVESISNVIEHLISLKNMMIEERDKKEKQNEE